MIFIVFIVLTLEQICSMDTKIKDNKEPILFPNDVDTTNEEQQQFNHSQEFQPSVHLGQIEDQGSKVQLVNPFNDLQQIKFDNTVDVEKDTSKTNEGIQHQMVFFDNQQPQVGDYHHFYQQAYHPPTYENPNNPEKTVLYKHESLFTRTRKFPYQFFQPNHLRVNRYWNI